MYESKAPTASRLCFGDVFPEELDWRTETTSSDRSTGLTKKPETALRNQKHRLHMYHPPTSTSLTHTSESSGADRRNRQRQLQDPWADKLDRSVPFNSDNKSSSSTSRVSRTPPKNKPHRAAKPYARTTGSNVARYKDYSELFGEPKGTILVLDGSSIHTKVARSLRSGDGLDIIVASNSAPNEIRDITKGSGSALDGTRNAGEASNLASDNAEHDNAASNSVSGDTKDIAEPSNSAFDHPWNDIFAASSANSEDTLLGDDYQVPNPVPEESDLEQCRQHDQQAATDDWISNVNTARALFTNFHEFDYNEFDYSTGLLYEL